MNNEINHAWKRLVNDYCIKIFQYLTRPDTSDSGVDTGEETTGVGGAGGSTSGGESSRAEKVDH